MNDLDFPLDDSFGPEFEGGWDPGFEGDRWVVVSRLGPYLKVFQRPAGFRKRFYHQIYSLPVRDWSISHVSNLLGGFCTMRAELTLRYQPTVTYVERNLDAVPDVCAHIVSNYQALLKDAIEKELLEAEDTDWLEEGLEAVEQQIETTINETLTAQNIQCRSNCQLEPEFKELPEQDNEALTGHFRHQESYLQLLRRNFQFRHRRTRELLKQEEEEHRARLEHQNWLLDQFRRDAELERAKAQEETERLKAMLKEEERRHSAEKETEKRLHLDRIRHEKLLRQMELDAKRRDRETRLKATRHSDEMLRREIELLILEKQRAELEAELEQLNKNRSRRQLATPVKPAQLPSKDQT